MDESGFEDNQDCIYAWSKKGKKFMVSKRENEVKEKIQQPGEEKKEKDLIAPIIFKGSLNAVGFEQ